MSQKQERYVWLDVETTGLDPKSDLLLEVAVWPTRSFDPFDLREEDLKSWVLYHDEKTLCAHLSLFTYRMHDKTGLLDEVGASGSVGCSNAICEHILGVTGADSVLYLAGSSVHFDAAFLRQHMPAVAQLFSHRILDVSSIGLVARSLGRVRGRLTPAHRAAGDIRQSINALHADLEFLKGVR